MKIGLLGHGTVGTGVRMIVDQQNTAELSQLQITKILVHRQESIKDARMTLDVNDILNDSEIDIIVECIGGDEPAFTYVKKALENGKHVVTCNKKMLANHAEELILLARKKGLALKYEAACGGGIPWMDHLDRTRRVDEIQSFRGIFNGTTNYILMRMSRNMMSFADALGEAQAEGYAEKDPSDDIDGNDVAYKVALSMIKGFDIIPDIRSIVTYGIRNICDRDMQYAHRHQWECKLLGTGVRHSQFVSGYVIPTFVKKTDLFATIPANFNAIESNSATLGKMIYVGQGAGSLPTAHAVVQNLADILLQQDMETYEKSQLPVGNQQSFGRFYIRSKRINMLADRIAVKIDEETGIMEQMSYAELNIMTKMLDDDALFVAEVADDRQ